MKVGTARRAGAKAALCHDLTVLGTQLDADAARVFVAAFDIERKRLLGERSNEARLELRLELACAQAGHPYMHRDWRGLCRRARAHERECEHQERSAAEVGLAEGKQVVRWWAQVRRVSKLLPMSALAVGLFAVACEPVSASVVELRDAGRKASDSVAARDGAIRSTPEPDPDGCMVLVDQTIPEVITDAAVVAERAVFARTASSAGCSDADAGVVLLQASVFSRRDGQPMVEPKQRYSYRWPAATTVMARVHLVGGDAPCADATVVDFAHGYQFAPQGFASCYEFTSPREAHYLRIDGTDYPSLPWITLGKEPIELRLCTAPCPAGSTHDFSQDTQSAGFDAGSLVPDASYVIPGLP